MVPSNSCGPTIPYWHVTVIGDYFVDINLDLPELLNQTVQM